LLDEIGCGGVFVQGASLVPLNPDPDQIARKVVAFRQTVQRLAGQKLLGDLTLEFDAVGSVLRHGHSSFESPASRSIAKPKLSTLRGPLHFIAAFASGLVFGLGLIVSHMVNPAKVLAFLDIFGNWGPSLALAMSGAVRGSALGYLLAKRRGGAVFAPRLEITTRRDLDPRLIGGAALFGIGWGLVGLCPGPAIAVLTFGPPQVAVFVAAMIEGMAVFRLVPDDWPHMSFWRKPGGVDG
jgi:uncharacterized membrane protein YedE/YeeE